MLFNFFLNVSIFLGLLIQKCTKGTTVRGILISLKLFLIAGLFCQIGNAQEQNDIYTVPKLVAVQNRSYNVNQNLSILLGYLPDDSFTKGYTAGLAYTYYFSDFTAWEIFNANYVFKKDTGLKQDLIDNYGAMPESDRLLDFPIWYATTGFVYTPLYNKNLLFNKSVVYGENSFVIGAGALNLKLAGMLPTVGGGIIFKFFIGQSTSLKLDIREWVYQDPERGVDGILDMKLGLDWQLGDTPRDTE